MKATKKGISGLLKRKNKGEKETSTDTKHSENDSSDITSFSIESESPQVSETSPNQQSMTCPNNRCGKVFDKPLQLIDLAKPSEETALVCPYCLSKLEPAQTEQEIIVETFSEEKFQGAAEQKEEGCPHFVGYLGKRPKDNPIPDFCLTCPQMMKCLLG